MSKETVQCPHCGNDVDVQELLRHDLEESLRQEYQAKLNETNNKLKSREDDLKAKELELDEVVNSKIKEGLENEKLKLGKEIEAKYQEESKSKISLLEEQVKKKNKELEDANKLRIEIEDLKYEKENLHQEMELKYKRFLAEEVSKQREQIKKDSDEENELKLRELEKKLEDQKKLTDEMRKKQEQGSMQLQGEVQELAIEDWLRSSFPFDEIVEIKKGARGGDCLQMVNTRDTTNCGIIYYESKRTKEFKRAWISKFKDDMIQKDAKIGVLVTETMPKELERMGLVDGIWVCTFSEFKGLCNVLRESLIIMKSIEGSQENKGDKMQMLYTYLTSNEFKLQMESIVEGFNSMKASLASEKRAMNSIWNEREKQIEKVINNSSALHGSIRGIAGTAIQPIKELEL